MKTTTLLLLLLCAVARAGDIYVPENHHGNRVYGLPTPTTVDDAATKSYVDTHIVVGTPTPSPTKTPAPALSWYGNPATVPADPIFNLTSLPGALIPAFTGDVTKPDGSTVTTVASVAAAALPAFTGDVTTAAGSTVTTVTNIPNATTLSGGLVVTPITAPTGNPTPGSSYLFVDSTTKNWTTKNDAGAVAHSVQSRSKVANSWIDTIQDNGTTAVSQPSFSNLAGNISISQMNGGAGASASTFWRGDNTWVAPSNAVSSVFSRTGAVVATANDYTFAQIGSKPTTLAGYGITDPVVLTSGSYSNPTWITSLAWSKLSGQPTTLAGYGITDAQPLDVDLTAIAALSGTNTIYYRSAAGVWSPVVIGSNMTFSSGTLNSVTGGNVNSSGVPTSGQLATWASASSIQGINTLPATNFPALTGDVTTSLGTVSTTIAPNKVTYSKMQAASASSKLVGSSSLGTNLQEISLGTNLTMSGATLNAAAPAYASLQTTQMNPTGSTGTAFVMAGMGSTAKITPTATGKILITVSGAVMNNTANGGVQAGIRYGTGAAPANGASVTGTPIGTQIASTGQNASAFAPFTSVALETSSVGTAIWIDLSFAASTAATQANLSFVTITAVELP